VSLLAPGEPTTDTSADEDGVGMIAAATLAMSDMVLSQHVAIAMRAGGCPTDEAFDRFLPYDLERASNTFWTPLEVAMRVAEWLDELGIETVLDIGSGAGKFCVAAALAGRSRFVGLEQRGRLVRAARMLAGRFGVADRVTFVLGTLETITTMALANAYYLYNPFGENTFAAGRYLDNDVELSPARLRRDVAMVENLFCDAPVNTYVITYNGFGGQLPSTYTQIRTDTNLPNMLRMWQKTKA